MISHVTSPTGPRLPDRRDRGGARPPGHRHARGRRPRPGHGPSRRHGDRRRLLHGQLPQVAVRAEGNGDPPRSPRSPGRPSGRWRSPMAPTRLAPTARLSASSSTGRAPPIRRATWRCRPRSGSWARCCRAAGRRSWRRTTASRSPRGTSCARLSGSRRPRRTTCSAPWRPCRCHDRAHPAPLSMRLRSERRSGGTIDRGPDHDDAGRAHPARNLGRAPTSASRRSSTTRSAITPVSPMRSSRSWAWTGPAGPRDRPARRQSWWKTSRAVMNPPFSSVIVVMIPSNAAPQRALTSKSSIRVIAVCRSGTNSP